MTTAKITDPLHNEMLFEQKNKIYGAFLIRRLYNSHMLASLIISLGITLFLFSLPILIHLWNSETIEPLKQKVIEYTELSAPPPIDKTVPPPPPIELPPPVKTTIKFLPPVVKPDEQVPEEKFATQEELKEAEAGTETVEGNGDVGGIEGEGLIEEPVEEKPFMIVEQMPQFPGGEAALFEYLNKNIKYPAMAKENHITGTVYVSFVVKSDGKISDVKVLRGIAGGCSEEAVRVISSMPDWKPGKQAGKAVAVNYNLPISFKLK